MKSFVKKLSVIVLAAAMVLAVLPAINATAGSLALGSSKATTKQSHDILVGEVLDLNFYGAKGYVERVDSHWVVWTSSNPEIATVDRVGKVKGLKVGTTTISVTATVKATGQSYSGSAKVNVREIDKGFEAELVKYVGGKATVELIFKNEANARANEKNVEVSRVRVTKIKRIDLKTKVDSVKLDGNKLIVTFPASEGVTYCINVKDVGSVDKLIATGKPVEAFISCKDVVVAAKDDVDPRSTANNKPAIDTEKIKCEVTDENGVIVAEFIGKDPGVVNAKLSGATINYKNVEKGINITSKTVSLSKQGDSVTINGEFSCKCGNENIKLQTNEITVKTINYRLPDGLDFALDVHLEDLDVDQKKISYDENCEFTATMNVRDSKQIVYVFEATDVNNNTGLFTGKNGYAYCTDENHKVGKLYTDYKFALDPEADHVVVVSETGKITAIKSGKEYVLIYTNDKKEELAGYLEVTVIDEPVLTEMVASENYLQGYNNAEKNAALVSFEVSLLDQNGAPISYNSLRGDMKWTNDQLPKKWLTANVKENDETVIVFTVDFTKVPDTSNKGSITTEIVTHNGAGEEVKFELTLDSYALTDEEETAYAVRVDDVTINNKALAAYHKYEEKNPNPVIRVMKTLGGIDKEEMGMYLMEAVPADAKDDDENPIVDVPNYIDYLASKKQLNDGIYVALFKDGRQVTQHCDQGHLFEDMVSTEASRRFDVTSLSIEQTSQILSGEYTARGWLVSTEGGRQTAEEIEGTEFTVTKDITGLADLEPVFKVNTATGQRTSEVAYNENMCNTDAVKDLVQSIVATFSGKYDFDYDGKFDNDFVAFPDDKFDNYLEAAELTKDEYILGSDGKTIYIKSLTIWYKVGGLLTSESWQINKSFVTRGFKENAEAVDLYFPIRKAMK